jgi:hypothetical protein
MTQKLNQVLAIERQTKGKSHSEITRIHKATQKPQLFNGFNKTYQPLDEDGERFPPESHRVQMNVPTTLKQARNTLSELCDVTATKDMANRAASANVVVDGDTILEGVPATTLLFLEKQLTDLHTFIGKLPTLDPSEEWNFDEAAGLFKTPASQTTKTKKVAKPIVLYQATEHHPAQTQLVQEDQIVGHWTKVAQSGAIPAGQKATMLERIEKLQKAVKFAREEANQVEAPDTPISGEIFGYLFQ